MIVGASQGVSASGEGLWHKKTRSDRGLAGWFETARFAAMLQLRYEIVWIDVGNDRKRNRSIAKRYGVAPIVGTPTVLVLNAAGDPLNLSEAGGWRNAASRSEQEIFDYFVQLGRG